MTKYEKLDELLEIGNGYLFTSDVEKNGISRTYLAKYVKEKGREKVAKGMYIAENAWEDELYILQCRYPRIVFCDETALYLHGLIDREYFDIHVTVPPKFNRTRLCEQGIVVRQEQMEQYLLGVVEIETNFGNRVRTYDRERCICDMIKNREVMEVQQFQTAMKTYMREQSKRMSRLMMYAKELKVREELMKYVEVMLW